MYIKEKLHLGEELCISIEMSCIPQDHTDLCMKLDAAPDIKSTESDGGTRFQEGFKLPPKVSGHEEHQARYDYLQESDASCPPTLELTVYP